MTKQILLMDNITKIYQMGSWQTRILLYPVIRVLYMRFLEKMVQEDYIDESPFGLITPESGKIYVKGQEIRFKDPLDAIKHGVGMVHQHFMLVDELYSCRKCCTWC